MRVGRPAPSWPWLFCLRAQVARYKQLLQQAKPAGPRLPNLKGHAMASICSALPELQAQPAGNAARQAQALQQLETSAKLLFITGAGAGCSGQQAGGRPAAGVASGSTAGNGVADQLAEVVILLDVVDALLSQQQQQKAGAAEVAPAAALEAPGQEAPQGAVTTGAAAAAGASASSCLSWLFNALSAVLAPWLQQAAAAQKEGSAAGSRHALAAAGVRALICRNFLEISGAGAGTTDAALELLCCLPGSRAAQQQLLGSCRRKLQLLGGLGNDAEATSSSDAAWQQGATAAAAQAFLQVLYHCCSIYQHEKAEFLQQLQTVRQQAGAAQQAVDGQLDDAPAAPAGTKRKAAAGGASSSRKGRRRGQQQEEAEAGEAAPAAEDSAQPEGFLYMQQEEQHRQDEAAAQVRSRSGNAKAMLQVLESRLQKRCCC
jgi:hypothetical protein